MLPHSTSHVSDQLLLRELAALVAQERSTTAAMLAHLAEVDARKLYLPAAYPSMYAWCVGELKRSEDMAAKRTQAARLARRFPAIFPMLADGRLHLSAVILLAPHLAPETAEELLAAAAKKSKAELERLLAERFPRPDLPTAVMEMGATIAAGEHAPGHVVTHGHELATGTSGALRSRAKVAPLSPARFAVQLTIGQETHDKLRYAQARLGHAIPSGDLAQVLDLALDTLIRKLEQHRFAATGRSHPGRSRHPVGGRYVPAAIRRLVWGRDGGRCTFVSESGRRCPARTRLEFDHIEPFARGGEATPHGLRLRCREHNLYEAERIFGTDFMRHKRQEARRRSAQTRMAGQTLEPTSTRARERERAAALRTGAQDVVPWLRSLGFSLAEARCGAARCGDPPDAPLEERVRAALSSLAPGGVRKVIPGAGGSAARLGRGAVRLDAPRA